MNLQDNILRILANGPLDFAELYGAVNAVSDPRFPWSEQWLAEQVRLAVWRGHVIKNADGKFSLPQPAA